MKARSASYPAASRWLGYTGDVWGQATQTSWWLRWAAALPAAWVFLSPLHADGAGKPDLQRHARPVRSVFHIAKSENRNQVHYGIKVDAQCRPTAGQPVYGYWRDFEDGPKAMSPLLSHEQSAYGVTRPRSVERSDNGGRVLFGLRGFPDRAITMQTFMTPTGECKAWAISPIKKQQALLRSIYVELGFLYSIDYVLLRGVSIQSGRSLQEKVDD